MALPHLPTAYTTRKQSASESAIVRRRENENDFRQKWEETAKYFHKTDLKVAKEGDWTSDKVFQDSMDAYNAERKKEDRRMDVIRRRRRLAELLEMERILHQAQLRELGSEEKLDLSVMREKTEALKSAREEKRKQNAEELMYEQFRKNNPDLRVLEWEQHRQLVVDSWGDQVKEKAEIREEERLRAEELHRAREDERQMAEEAARREVERKRMEERRLRNFQQRQVEEIREREAEAEALRKMEADLQRQKEELEEMERERAQVEQSRKKQEHGRILLRQHTAALKRRSKQIQEDLEADLAFLKILTAREERDVALKSARREKERADANWMRNVVEEQLRLEQIREAELDNLFQEEAAKLWAKREDEWERERQARERLMKEVLDERQVQITEQISAARQRQAESLAEREQMLDDLERAQRMTVREEEDLERERRRRRAELEGQMTERRDRHLAVEIEKQEEEEDERRAEEAYEEMLRQEAARMQLRGRLPSPKGSARRRF